MPGIEQQTVDMQKSGESRAPMDWQRVLLGWGFLTLIGALFVGAATKSGGTAKAIGAVGLLLIIVSTVTLIARWLQAKTSNGGKKANAPAGSRP